MTTSSQPLLNLVLNGPHGPALHDAKPLVDLKRRQLSQIKPVFIYLLAKRSDEVRVHRCKDFNPHAEISFSKNLRLKARPVLFARGPTEFLQRRQACKDDPGFPAPEREMLITPVNCPAILEDFNHRIAAKVVFDHRKLRILARAHRRSLAMRTESLVKAWIQRTTFFGQGESSDYASSEEEETFNTATLHI